MKKLLVMLCICLSLVGCNQSKRTEELNLDYFKTLLKEVYQVDLNFIDYSFTPLANAYEEAYFVKKENETLYILTLSPEQKRAEIAFSGTKEQLENVMPLVKYLCDEEQQEMLQGYIDGDIGLTTKMVVADRCNISYNRIRHLDIGETHYLTLEFW